jgi:hypothetical protein
MLDIFLRAAVASTLTFRKDALAVDEPKVDKDMVVVSRRG